MGSEAGDDGPGQSSFFLVASKAADLRGARTAAGQGSVPVVTRHLLDDVDLAGGVGPEGGDGDAQPARPVTRAGETDRLQVAHDGVVIQLGPEDGVDPGGAHADVGRVRHRAAYVDDLAVGAEARAGRDGQYLAQPEGSPVDPPGSQPRSNRADASERIPRRLVVRAMAIGAK